MISGTQTILRPFELIYIQVDGWDSDTCCFYVHIMDMSTVDNWHPWGAIVFASSYVHPELFYQKVKVRYQWT